MATDPRDEITTVESTKKMEKKKTTSPDEMSYDDTLKDLEAVLGRPPWTTVEKDENSTTAPPASAAHAAMLNRPPTPALGTPDRPIEIDTSNDALQIDVDERDLDFSLRPVEKTPPRRSIPSLSTSSPTATLDECKVMRFFLKCAWSNPDKEALRPIINIRERCLAKSLAELDLDYNSFMAGGPDPLTGRDSRTHPETEDFGQKEVSVRKIFTQSLTLVNMLLAGSALRPPPVMTTLKGSNQEDEVRILAIFMYIYMYLTLLLYFYLRVMSKMTKDLLVISKCNDDLSMNLDDFPNKPRQILSPSLLSFFSKTLTLLLLTQKPLTLFYLPTYPKNLSALSITINFKPNLLYYSCEPLPDEPMVSPSWTVPMEQNEDRTRVAGTEKEDDIEKNFPQKQKDIVIDRDFLIY